MTETPQEYTSRMLSHTEGHDPWAVLTTTAERLRALVRGRAESDLQRPPAPARWSVAEILAHLADAEVVAGWRLRSILATNAVTLQPFDQNVWADAFRYDATPVEESLALFSANRAANLALLQRVSPTRHDHYGVHAERGHESIRHLIRLYAGHDRNHLAQIERLLGA
ncbi:MAG: DinB family protein [Vicinamibacterales bacterium]